MSEQGTAVARPRQVADGEGQGTFRYDVARIAPAASEVMPQHFMTPKRMLALVYAAATKTPALRLHDREPRHVPDDLRRAGLEPDRGARLPHPPQLEDQGARGEPDRWEMVHAARGLQRGSASSARRSGDCEHRRGARLRG